MKITIAVNYFSPNVGGSEYVCQRIAEHWSKQHDVFILTNHSKERNLSNFKYNIIEYDKISIGTCIKKLEQINPDVLMVYSDYFDAFRNIITRNNPKYKLIVNLCGANWIYKNPSFANTFYRAALNIHKIVCHSIYERDYKFCSNKNLIDKTVIVPNGIDLEEFDNNNISKEQIIKDLNLPKNILNSMWILNVSNFFIGKGQIKLIHILERIKSKNVVYIQVASDPSFTSVNYPLELIWEKTHKYVPSFLLKNIPRKYVIALFKQSNVFALPSEKEVAPIVLLESMAAKCPWVACDVGNVSGLKGGKYIRAPKDFNYKVVFDDWVIENFAKAIDEMLQIPLIGENGRKQIENEFNWSKIFPMYDLLLN